MKTSMAWIGLLPTAVAAQAHAQQSVTIRWGDVVAATHPSAQMIERIAADVKQKSNGRIAIQAFPAGQLGGSRDKIDATANSFPLLAAPLFILMGNIMNSAGISYRIFDFATALVSWMRGGLCHANIVGSVIFAGMSDSAVADAAGLGTVEIAAMKKEGYDAATAGAITAASATIGPIIPPALPMIVYGVTAETSIGALFLAGIVPGLLMAPVVLFGGMFSGVFTPTEAAAIAVVYALVLGLFVYREFPLSALPKIIIDTVETTDVVMALVMTAALLGYCISVSRLPQEFGTVLTGLTSNPLVYLAIVNVLLLVVGCFMEALSAMLALITSWPAATTWLPGVLLAK